MFRVHACGLWDLNVICENLRLITLRSQLEVCEKESSIFFPVALRRPPRLHPPMAECQSVRVSANKADSGSTMQSEGERCPSPSHSPILALPDLVLGANSPLLYRPPWEIPIRRDLLSQLQQGSRVRPIWSHVRPNFSRVRLTKIPGRTGASSHSRKEKKSIRDSETLWFNKRHPR